MMFTHQLLKAALASACLAVVLGGGVWAVRAAEQPEAKDTSTPKPDAPRPKPDAPKPKPGDPLAPQAGLDEAAVHKLLLQTVTTDQTVPNHRWSSFPAAEHRFARRKDAEFEALFPGFELWNVHNQSPIGGINPLWTLALDRANRRGFLLGSNTASPFEKNLDAFLKAAAYKPKDEAGATRCAAWIVRMSAQNTCFLAGDDFAKVAPEGKDLVAKLAQPDAKKDAGNGAYTVRVDSCEEFRWIHNVRVTLRRWTVTFPAAGGASLQAEVLETVPKK